MTKDLSILEKQNADKFNNVQYLHGFRFGVLEGYDEGYQQGRREVVDEELMADIFMKKTKQAFQEGIDKGRVEAIDEFVEEMKKEPFSDYVMNIVCHIAERLKE